MKISVVHPHRVTREVLSHALATRLSATVVDFSSIEELLSSSMEYDVFVLYNIFGREKMDRWEGVKWIRYQKPDAVIISMIHYRFFERRFAAPGGDAVLLRVNDETEGLIKLIKQGHKAKSFILVSGMRDTSHQ
jgi:DNA-binding NarL/FixJ family response regulator